MLPTYPEAHVIKTGMLTFHFPFFSVQYIAGTRSHILQICAFSLQSLSLSLSFSSSLHSVGLHLFLSKFLTALSRSSSPLLTAQTNTSKPPFPFLFFHSRSYSIPEFSCIHLIILFSPSSLIFFPFETFTCHTLLTRPFPFALSSLVSPMLSSSLCASIQSRVSITGFHSLSSLEVLFFFAILVISTEAQKFSAQSSSCLFQSLCPLRFLFTAPILTAKST